jgi:hypothetical protein
MQAVWGYVAFKGYWSALEAMLLSPVLAFIAIAQDAQLGDHTESGLQYARANTDAEIADIEGVDEVDNEPFSVDVEHTMEVDTVGAGVDVTVSPGDANNRPSYVVT